MKRIVVLLVALSLTGCLTLPPGMEAPDFSGIRIGMTMQAVVDLIGPPGGVNTTITATVVHKQWIYTEYSWAYQSLMPVAYLYFDNGILTAMQR